MRRHRNPAAHVHHDQPHLLVAPPQPARIPPRHRLRIQRMADKRSLHQRRAREPRAILPLIHRHRIHNVRIYSRRPRKTQRQHRTQVRCMLASPRPPELLHHRVVHQIRPAFHRGQKASASGHRRPAWVPHPKRVLCVEGGCGVIHPRRLATWTKSCLGKRRLDLCCAILQPVQHWPPAEPLNLVVAVVNGPRHLLARARKDAELGRRRSRVQDQHPFVFAAQSPPRSPPQFDMECTLPRGPRAVSNARPLKSFNPIAFPVESK